MVLIWQFGSLCSDRRMLCTRGVVSGLGPAGQRVVSTLVTLPHRAGPHALGHETIPGVPHLDSLCEMVT